MSVNELVRSQRGYVSSLRKSIKSMSNTDVSMEVAAIPPNPDERTKKQGRENVKKWMKLISAIIFDVLVLALTFVFLYWSFKASGFILFAWHPALMALSFICCMTEGLLIYSNYSLLSRTIRKYTDRVLVHWILQTMAVVFLVLGFITIVANKFKKNSKHFQSTHAIIGLITFICTFVAVVGGVLAKYSVQLRKKVRPINLKLAHSISALIVYILGFITIILGLYTHWFEKFWSPQERIVCICAIILVFGYSVYNPIKNVINRIKQLITSI